MGAIAEGRWDHAAFLIVVLGEVIVLVECWPCSMIAVVEVEEGRKVAT